VRTDLQQPAAGIQLEEIGCPLCGSRRSTFVLDAMDPDEEPASRRYAVVRCADCSFCFTNPRPTLQTIAQAYRADYGPHQGQRTSPRRRSRWLARWRKRRQLDWQGQGRLLDFGCGSGGFLQRMHQDGWNVAGLDSSPQAVERVRRELGLPAFLGTLPHPELKPESFDVVTLWQALEHVPDPLAVLQAARQILVHGGRLVIAVPNFESAGLRWFGPDWFGLDLPRHLIHFTPDTLRRTVEQAGFRVERLEPVGHASWLHNSAKRAARGGQKLGWRQGMLLRPICRAIAWWCVLAGTADAMTLTAVAE
jgi:SAM-dependent methyltransferase